MANSKARIRKLEKIAYGPYERIEHPTAEDWRKSYDALKKLSELLPEESGYPNTLGYLCYYGRHTGGERLYEEARAWFLKGAKLRSIESTYKLADMLAEGLGGPADRERAWRLYVHMYLYCRDQFENGMKDSKFADTALRMGRLFHEGKIAEKNDLEALGYLLEAKYAIDWRKQYGHYGDETVEKNIAGLIDECEKPPEEVLKKDQYGLALARVPHYLIPSDEVRMTMDITVDDEGGRPAGVPEKAEGREEARADPVVRGAGNAVLHDGQRGAVRGGYPADLEQKPRGDGGLRPV